MARYSLSELQQHCALFAKRLQDARYTQKEIEIGCALLSEISAQAGERSSLMDRKPWIKTFDEMTDDCQSTGLAARCRFGDKPSYQTPNGVVMCEGRGCEDAYEQYVDDVDPCESCAAAHENSPDSPCGCCGEPDFEFYTPEGE